LNYNKLVSKIDFKNLTRKQQLLLKSPRILLQSITNFKIFLLKIGIEVTSY